MSIFIIYKTTNLVNGKIYVGQHNTSADDGYLGSGNLILLAIKKYGRENFIRETLEYCNSVSVDVKETHWILKLEATNKKIGYNIKSQGQKIYDRLNGIKHPMYGKHHTNETKNKISQKMKGNKLSEKTKNKISESLLKNGRSEKENLKQSKRMIGKNNPMFNKKHSDQTKKKMSKNHCNFLGTKNPNFGKGKYVYKFVNTNSKEITETKSLTEFCRQNDLNFNSLNWCFRVGQKIHKNFQIERRLINEKHSNEFKNTVRITQ